MENTVSKVCKTMNFEKILGRNNELFAIDISSNEVELSYLVSKSKFLVIGGAGSIGQSVVFEIFSRSPKLLHVVDINENNLVELVRTLRSSLGYISGEFKTFAIDCGGPSFDALINNSVEYDYVLNLSALKHVRSERDPYTLMRMIEVNILNTQKTLLSSSRLGVKKYFCVSTDKAANPVNLMGASKRIMEKVLHEYSGNTMISSARFANVAFSDGSLLHGFNQRFLKKQPIAAPIDISRYFITPKNSGQLCLLSCLLGKNGDTFFPKLNPSTDLIKFSEIARRFIEEVGYEVYECESEDQARQDAKKLISRGQWPCYFFYSDTTGEKLFEEFYEQDDTLDMNKFHDIGVLKNIQSINGITSSKFISEIDRLRSKKQWTKIDIVDLVKRALPDFEYIDKEKYLDEKM